MNRTKFFTMVEATATGELIDSVKELDFLWNSLTSFTLKYNPSYYRVLDSDLMRPDRISDKSYGTPNFWWIICLINEIDNPLIDLQVGQILKIPSAYDIFNFQRKYRVRRT